MNKEMHGLLGGNGNDPGGNTGEKRGKMGKNGEKTEKTAIPHELNKINVQIKSDKSPLNTRKSVKKPKKQLKKGKETKDFPLQTNDISLETKIISQNNTENKRKKTGRMNKTVIAPEFTAVKTPKIPISKWIKELKGSGSITRNQVSFIYRNVIFTKSFGELRKIMENEDLRDGYPAIVIAVIAGVLGDIARGNILNISRMLAFIFPESTNSLDLTAAVMSNSPEADQIRMLEDTLRKLEGDDAIMIVDKLVAAEDVKYTVQAEPQNG
jgi:hypothetical protein